MKYFIYGCLIMAAILLAIAGITWCVSEFTAALTDYYALKAFEKAMTR